MSGAKNCPETPRQKMIGMMYLVLTAMLALNVSADILNGFRLVNQSLNRTLAIAQAKNNALYDHFQYLADQNPDKVGDWLKKAKVLRTESDRLYDYIETMKWDIARIADGAEGDPSDLSDKGAGNLDAAGQIGLVETGEFNGRRMIRATVLRNMIGAFSDTLQNLVQQDSIRRDQVRQIFTTEDSPQRPWERQVFEFMPAAAAISVLSKLQNDIRNSEAEIITYLIAQIDAGDYRVNKLDAMVIPVSTYVMRGGKFSAQIVLAAIDTTKRPVVMVGGREIPGGLYEAAATSVGNFSQSGFIKLERDNAPSIIREFKFEYTVGEPAVIVSADLMNVFYAGFDNPVSISVPGVPSSQIQASATGGTLTRTATGWSVRPARVGQNCEINVSAKIDDRTMTFPPKVFRVKALPDPAGFIAYTDANGNPAKYWGGTPFNKALLLGARGVLAELKDADLDVKYKVLGFDVNFFDNMGNTIIELSDGDKFSERQMSRMRQLPSGRKFFISRIRAMGPDNIERTLPPIEVVVR